jgi:signal transduction histidine kinase
MSYHADIMRLEPMVGERLKRLSEGIRLHDTVSQGEATTLIEEERGKTLVEDIRSLVGRIEQQQTDLIAHERGRIQFLSYLALIISIGNLILMSAFAALIYYLYIRAIQAEHKLDQAKDEFVSLASHQLRTPATGIKSILTMLRAGDLGELSQRQQHFIGRAIQSNDREIRIIDELLNVARADAGRLVFKPSLVELTGLVGAVIAEQRPAIEDKGVTLQFHHPRAPVHLTADEEKLFMAIANLLDNARKYTPEQGKITVKITQRRDNITIEVTDTGMGIEESEVSHVFDRFQRAHNVINGDIEGTGLGLYLVRSIAELHNGGIDVSSKKGHGSRFVMTLPQRRA